jgi:hypothetical protein
VVELDHVVYFSEKSPEVNVQEHKGTTIGGKHKNWGTFNALTYTQNSYIEYLSVEHMDIAKRANHPLTNLLLHDLERGEGWGTICFRTDNIVALNDRLNNEGWVTSGVLDAERETSSGFIRKWKMLFIEQEVSDELPLPFFIEWEEPFEERMKSLREDGTITSENDSLIISICEFAVDNPEKRAEEWGQLLNLTPTENSLKLPNTELLFHKRSHDIERLVNVQITEYK